MPVSLPIPFYYQQGQYGCGVACLRMLAASALSPAQQARAPTQTWATPPANALTLRELLDRAQRVGLQGHAFAATYEELVALARPPCVALLNYRHYVVITAITPGHVHVADPARGLEQHARPDFIRHWYQFPAAEGVWVQFN